MNVGRCYTSPAEYLANCTIPALGWKWSSDCEVIESSQGATLLWAGEMRDILQQAQGLGLPNLRVTLMLAAALLRREVYLASLPAPTENEEPLAALARKLSLHPLMTRLERGSPLPYQVGQFVQRVFQGLELDGFFGGDPRDALALLDGQHTYRQLRKRWAGAPKDPPLGVGLTDVQAVAVRLNDLNADDILDLWKTGHTHLAAYDEVLTTLGRDILAYAQEQAGDGPDSGPMLTPDEAMREIARMEGGEVVLRAAQGSYPALHFPSLRSRAEASPSGGYSDITRRGSIDRVLISQLAYDADEFLRRFAENELLYFQNQTFPAIPTQPLICLVDMGVHMWGRPRLLAAGCALAAWKSSLARRRPFEMFQTQFGGVAPLTPDQPRRLAAYLTGIDDSESPAEACADLFRRRQAAVPHGDLLLVTSVQAWREPSLHRALAPLAPAWRVFAITLDRNEEMRFWQAVPGSPSARLLSRVDFRSLAPRQDEAPATTPALAAETDRILPNLFRLGHREPVSALAFTPDSSILFSGDLAGRVCWWAPRRKTLEQEIVLPRHGMFVRGLCAGATVLAVLAQENTVPPPPDLRTPAAAARPAGAWRLFRYNLLSGEPIDECALPVPSDGWLRWPKLAPDQNSVSLAMPGQILQVHFAGGGGRAPQLDTIAVPGTPIAYVQGRRWDMQYILTEQRNLYRIEFGPRGGYCRHLRPEPGAQIAVDREGGILALRGRDLVNYPANPNRDSGPSDESIVASLKDSSWQSLQGAWDGSVLLSSPQQSVFLPEDSRQKPTTIPIPLAPGAPWTLSPWASLMAVGLQREVRVFQARTGEALFFARPPRLQSSVMSMFFGSGGNELWVNYGATCGHQWAWNEGLEFRQTQSVLHPARSVSYSLINSAVHRIEFYAGRALLAMGRHRIEVIGNGRGWNSCDELVSCAVHPDDALLAVLDSRNVIWLMRADDLRLIAALYASENGFAAWSAAGHRLGNQSILAGSAGQGPDQHGGGETACRSFADFLRSEARLGPRPAGRRAPAPTATAANPGPSGPSGPSTSGTSATPATPSGRAGRPGPAGADGGKGSFPWDRLL
ncbi:MAG: hypothetical protein ACREJ2_01160 [Planctomycetota bacterium]